MRAQNGKGSFNWRWKFKTMLPVPSMTEGLGILNVQCWDWDFPLTEDDYIGEARIDLRKHMTRAFAKHQVGGYASMVFM